MTNLSTLARAGTGSNVLTAGLVIGPGAGDTVLIRAVGPTLATAPFNIGGFLPDPVLTLFNSNAVPIAVNGAWNPADAATMSSVYAFPLIPGSKDADIVITLQPGAYTAQVSGATGDSGTVLLEVYEVAPAANSSHLINLSGRAQLASGAVETAGLTVGPGAGTRTLLIRGVGPGLTSLGVPGALSDPAITVFNSSTTVVASNDDWGTPVGAGAASAAALDAAFAESYAFPLASGSKDSALIMSAAPGSYTVQLSGNAGAAGDAMIEVYDITSVVAIAATTPNASTGGTAGEFTVSRTGDTSQAITVGYSVGGTAVPAWITRACPGLCRYRPDRARPRST